MSMSDCQVLLLYFVPSTYMWDPLDWMRQRSGWTVTSSRFNGAAGGVRRGWSL